MPSNIQIVLIAGATVFFLFIMYLFFRSFFTRKLIQSSIDDTHSMLFQGELVKSGLNLKPEPEKEQILEQELIILNLVSMDKSNFDMNQVITLLKNLDAKYVNGFFSCRDLNGNESFRIASGINPGLIETDTNTHVLIIALDLYQAYDPYKSFERMLECAFNISEKLHASLCDSSRAPLSKQMIEHYKSKAQEISLLQATKNNSKNDQP